MKNYLKIFLLCSSLFFVFCVSQGMAQNTKGDTIAAPLTDGYNTLLSGLVLVKYNAVTTDYNIVFLSEMGLTICELYSLNNVMEVRNKSQFFKSKAALKTLMEDFGYLLHNTSVKRVKNDGRLKGRNKATYSLDENDIVFIQRKRLINGVKTTLNEYDNGLPQFIQFKHSGIKLNIDLTLIKRK